MPAEPRVSVVIPTYNQADFLREALESVLAQTIGDWEAIVINNHSEDHTRDVALSFGDPRICLIEFRNEGVIAASRNRGIETARAEWIAFLDSDDSWKPDKLARCLEMADESVDVIAHGLSMVRDGVTTRRHLPGPPSRTGLRGLLFEGSCATPSAALVRRDKLLELGLISENPAYRTAEDYEMWLRLARGGARFRFFDDALTDYRLHGANASGSARVHMEATLAIVEAYFALLPDAGWRDRLRLSRRRAAVLYGGARNFHAAGDHRAARAHFLKALAADPTYWRTLPGLLLSYAR